MADPFRLRVMKNLTTLLEAVAEDSNSTGAVGGAQHTLAGKVFRGRNLFGESDPLPMIAILETPVAIDQLPAPEEQSSSSGLWDISIQGFAKDDKDNPTDPAYRLAADVIVALAAEKKRPARERQQYGKVRSPLLGEAGVLDIIIGSPVHRPPDDISGKAYFWLQISIKVAENHEQPYG